MPTAGVNLETDLARYSSHDFDDDAGRVSYTAGGTGGTRKGKLTKRNPALELRSSGAAPVLRSGGTDLHLKWPAVGVDHGMAPAAFHLSPASEPPASPASLVLAP